MFPFNHLLVKILLVFRALPPLHSVWIQPLRVILIFSSIIEKTTTLYSNGRFFSFFSSAHASCTDPHSSLQALRHIVPLNFKQIYQTRSMSYSTLKSRVNWPSLCTYFLPFQLFSKTETYPVSKSKNEQLDSSFIYNRGFPAKTKEAICRSTSQSRILAQGLLQRHLFFPFSQ